MTTSISGEASNFRWAVVAPSLISTPEARAPMRASPSWVMFQVVPGGMSTVGASAAGPGRTGAPSTHSCKTAMFGARASSRARLDSRAMARVTTAIHPVATASASVPAATKPLRTSAGTTRSIRDLSPEWVQRHEFPMMRTGLHVLRVHHEPRLCSNFVTAADRTPTTPTQYDRHTKHARQRAQAAQPQNTHLTPPSAPHGRSLGQGIR